jgi:NAD(P)-dependent dehydrogenase (short-subunit alcohol dehydrogenase family)
LQDNVIVVAGASTGIGRATALRLAGEGARLVVGSPEVEADKIENLVAEIKAAGGVAVGASFDATSDASAKALIDKALTVYGRLDAVHANFADMRIVAADTDAVTVSDEVIERTLDVSFKGMLRITRHAVPALLEYGGGALIYTSSIGSLMGEPVRPVYGMSKAAINALVRHLASKWGKEGLRANAILPGFVITPEIAEFIPEEFTRQHLDACRSPRVGEPQDIAAMVAMLASPDGSWISGQTIAVDGGETIR